MKQLLLAENLDQFFVKSLGLTNLNAVGLTAFEVSSFLKVYLEDLNFTSIYSEVFLIRVVLCEEEEGCFLGMHGLAARDVERLQSDWISLSLTKGDISNVVIHNLTHKDYNFPPRRVFYFDKLHYLQVKNISLVLYQHSIRCFLEFNDNLEVRLLELNITNEWVGALRPEYFASVISANRGKVYTIEKIKITGLAGIPSEAAINYKNGFMNFYGSDSDMIKVRSEIVIDLKEVLIINSYGWPYGVMGFTNIAYLTIENVIVQNSSSVIKAGAILIAFSDDVVLRNIYIKDTKAIEGGSIYMKKIENLAISKLEILDASAKDGGALHISMVNNASFEKITAGRTKATGKGGLIYLEKVNIKLKDIITNKCSSGAEGGVLFSKKGRIEVVKATFYDSQSKNGGVASILQADETKIVSVSIVGARSLERGVSMLLFAVKQAVFENVSLSRCVGSASLGNIYIENQEKFNPYSFINVICQQNEILKGNCFFSQLESDIFVTNLTVNESGGSAFYFVSRSGSALTFRSCSLLNNLLGESKLDKDSLGLFQNLEVKFIGAGNLITRNSAASTLLRFESCNVTLENIVLLDNTGTQKGRSYVDIAYSGDFLSAKNIIRSVAKTEKNKNFSHSFLLLKTGELSLRNSSINGCSSLEASPCISLEDSKHAYFENTFFFQNGGQRVGSIYSKSSIVKVLNCSFQENNHDRMFSIKNIDGLLPPTELRASDILFESSGAKNNFSLELKNCSFSVGLNSLSVTVYKANIFSIEGCAFLGGTQKSTAIFFFSCSGKILNSNFTGFSDDEGGSAVKAVNLDSAFQASLQIESCFFSENKASWGGAIILQGLLSVNVNSTTFKQNQAGIGGAIYYTCLSCRKCSVVLTNNEFKDNSASYYAPTVFSQAEIDKNQSVSNKFLNNFDGIRFTEGFSSYPVSGITSRLIDSESEQEIIWNALNDRRTIISGGYFDFNLTLVDHFGQTLIFENTTSSTLRKGPDSKAQVLGGFSQSSRGILMFKNVRVIFQPDSELQLELQINFDESSFLPLVFEATQLSGFVVTLDMFVRPCLVGEKMILGDSSCYKCDEGQYSLSDPMTLQGNKTLECLPCPEGAICQGGSDLIPQYGYWRASAKSAKIVECLSQSFCLGGDVINATVQERVNGRCLLHHEGNLCYKCSPGFARSGNKGICEACHSNALLQFKIAVSLILIYLYIVLQIKFTFSGESRSSIAILMKQLLTHVQLIQMISILDLGWTPDILNYFHYQEYVSFLSEEMVSLDCFFADIEADNLILRILMANLTPPAIILTLLINLPLLFFLRRLLKKTKTRAEEFLLYFKASIVITIYVFLPEILKKSFSLLNCITIDDFNNTEVIRLSPDNACWDDKHYKNIYRISLPAIITWGIFIPLLALGLLIRNRGAVRSVIRKRRDLNARSAATKIHQKVNLREGAQFVVKVTNENGLAKQKIRMKFDKETDASSSQQAPETAQKPAVMDSSLNISESKSLNPGGLGVVIIFKFLYRGYREQFYFWEIIIYMKKFVLTVISSFTGLFPSNTKATILLIIVSLFLLFQARYRPFELAHLNNVEFFSLLVTFVTANVGIMLYSEDLKQFSAIFLSFLIAINVSFICYWTFVFVRELLRAFWPGKRVKTSEADAS